MVRNNLYVHGNNNVMIPAHIHYGKYLLDKLRLHKEMDAIEDGFTGEKLTFKEILEYAVKLSIALTKVGVRKGDIIVLGSEPRLMFIPTALGILLAGAAYAPINSDCGRSHLHHKMTITKPKFCLLTELFWRTHKETLILFNCMKRCLSLDGEFESLTSVNRLIMSIDIDIDSFEPAPVVGQVDTALFAYSSGTTGMPKGVELSHLNCIIYSLPYDFKDETIKVSFLTGDWYHTYDIFMAYKMLSRGTKVVYNTVLAPEMLINTFVKTQINIAFLVPSLVNLLTKTDIQRKGNLDCFKYMFITASPIHANTLDEFKKRFPSVQHILQGYGTTETFFITSETVSPKGPRLGSVGGVCPCITVKVENPTTGELLGPNNAGEICIKGQGLMKGYSGLDPATYLDKEGFFKTGDLGYYDSEGYFYIVDRLKEVIDYDGDKVAPAELESILLTHPGVKEAGVVGKNVPIFGQEPTAFVVRQQNSNVTEQEIVDFIAAEVAPHMQLKGGVIFITKMPKNSRGKILRQDLRNMLKHSIA